MVIGAGVCAALHIGELPPAIATPGDALGLTLLQAGFLLVVLPAPGLVRQWVAPARVSVMLGLLLTGAIARRLQPRSG